MWQNVLHITLILIFIAVRVNSQISPGDLSNAHAELEGIMKCTECHVLGKKVSNNLCLDCHDEIKSLIDQKKGYHASGEVAVKECASCHSDHHGRNFKMARFEEDNFKHQLAGFDLKGKHSRIDCRDCHKPDLIVNNDFKNNKNTFLGLDQGCLFCHEDVHQKTLSQNCASCHDTEAFSPAAHFNHNESDFLLKGKHQDVACIKCHKVERRNGKEFQRFVDIDFQQCTSCHKDVHDNKFGQNCNECHSEASFNVARASKIFNHQMTGFDLLGKHRNVDCKQCHVKSFTNPMPHNSCTSCHTDYHNKEFAKNGLSPDCAECHTVNGFTNSMFTIEEHNEGAFPLEGGHLATPCFACHKQTARWRFREIGERCVECHEDVHKNYIDEKYYPNQSCESCHSITTWKENHFDHNQTNFVLAGAHGEQDCMACHGPGKNSAVHKYQNFQNLSMACTSCHKNVHLQQFDERGVTNCKRCHGFENWEAIYFNHDKTAFKLDGKHLEVDCAACHKEKEEQGGIVVQYKIKSYECIDCHQ